MGELTPFWEGSCLDGFSILVGKSAWAQTQCPPPPPRVLLSESLAGALAVLSGGTHSRPAQMAQAVRMALLPLQSPCWYSLRLAE